MASLVQTMEGPMATKRKKKNTTTEPETPAEETPEGTEPSTEDPESEEERKRAPATPKLIHHAIGRLLASAFSKEGETAAHALAYFMQGKVLHHEPGELHLYVKKEWMRVSLASARFYGMEAQGNSVASMAMVVFQGPGKAAVVVHADAILDDDSDE